MSSRALNSMVDPFVSFFSKCVTVVKSVPNRHEREREEEEEKEEEEEEKKEKNETKGFP